MNALTNMLRAPVIAAALCFACLGPAMADSKVVATVNGQPITELDMSLAETEIGRDLGQLPESTRRRVLVEYLIENFLFAKAAEEAKIDSGPAFDERLKYMRRRALRETYFEEKIKKSVSESAAETFYNDRVKGMKPTDEVKARHILVKEHETALDLKEQISRGGDFAELAKKHSTDPGSKVNGGMLGFFSRGQMVPTFEQAAFELKKGEVSEPVQSRFGWHLIKVEDTRQKPIPTFAEVKVQIMNSLVHQKTQGEADKLRGTAKVEYLDPVIKKEVEDQKKKKSSQQKQFEQRVKDMAAEKDKKGKSPDSKDQSSKDQGAKKQDSKDKGSKKE